MQGPPVFFASPARPSSQSGGARFQSFSGWSATLLLPSPTPSAAHTAAALEAHAATVLLADTHTLKALNAADDDDDGGGFKPPSSLRGGFVKVGSGEALGAGPPVDWSGVPLTTVGKMPAKK